MEYKYGLIILMIVLIGLFHVSITVLADTSEQPVFYTENIESIPDLMQTDKKADFPGGGSQYCCLVAISNSLMWLDSNGFSNLVENSGNSFDDQVKLTKLLGSQSYMDTNLEEGTGTINIMRGLKKYVQDCGYEIERLEYQGWREHPEEMKTSNPVPKLDWIKQGILNKGSVWLNVGWYTCDPAGNQYQRIGGHWVTLVGYGKNENGKLDSSILILHDPSPRAGHDFSNEYARTVRIGKGVLAGKYEGLPRSAAGYYKLSGGMHISSEADAALIDGVLTLRLKTVTNQSQDNQSVQKTPGPIQQPGDNSPGEQAVPKLESARAMLKGENKNTKDARAILLDLSDRDSASLTPVQYCYVYVYLGYIEDLSGNRQGAIGWFSKACQLDKAKQDAIYNVAERGLQQPITWIRHLDEDITKSQNIRREAVSKNKNNAQGLGKGAVLKDEPKDTGMPDMNLSGAERLENFDILAEAIDANYSFFTHKNIDWLRITKTYRQKVEIAGTNEEFYALLYQLVRELKDAHSWLCNYKKPPELGGFSPQVYTRLIEGKLVVTEVTKDSEAYAHGLRPGTIITGIDGMSVEEKIEANRPLMGMYSSERCFLEQACREILNGKKDSTVSIRFIVSGRNVPAIVKLKRTTSQKEKITEPDFHINKNKYIWDGVHPGGYGYIRIVSFSGREEIADEFDLALKRLKNTPALIIDVRENPGGFGTAQPRIIGRLIASRTRVDIGYKKNGPGHDDFSVHETCFEPVGDWQYTKPIALLTNAITGSASDLFVCRMVSTGRAITVGSGTHGNSTGTCVFVRLPCNLVVRISAGYICDTNGNIIEGNGNVPEIYAESTIADVLNGTDSVLERAIKELQKTNGNHTDH